MTTGTCPGVVEAAQDYLARTEGGGGGVLTWLAGVLSEEAADRSEFSFCYSQITLSVFSQFTI